MKYVFSMLLLVMVVMAIGGFLGVAIEESPGYVQIRYESFLLETSFWFFILMLACSIFFVFSLLFVFRRILMIRNQVAANRSRKAERMLLQRRDVAICAMIECRWQEANNLFTELSNESKAPLMFLLLAAKCAHNLGLSDDCDSLLERAQSLSEESRRTSAYLRAQFYIADGKHRDAARLLADIRAQDELPEIWREKLLMCYEALGDKQKVEALSAELR